MPLNLSVRELAVGAARLPFAEQVAFFQSKLGNLVPTTGWRDMQREQHDRGFMVAGATKAQLLADLASAVDEAIAQGTGIEAFRQQFDAAVDKAGWAYQGARNWRTRVIYQTNLATSYAAGRYKQLSDPELLRLKPYWMYRHSDSVLTPRPLHVSWDGLALRADDPWWSAHYPPNDWGCACYVVAVSARDVSRVGGRIAARAPDDGVGPDGRPNGVGEGWDYTPGASTVERAVRAQAEKLPDQLRLDLLADVASVRARRGRP